MVIAKRFYFREEESSDGPFADPQKLNRSPKHTVEKRSGPGFLISILLSVIILAFSGCAANMVGNASNHTPGYQPQNAEAKQIKPVERPKKVTDAPLKTTSVLASVKPSPEKTSPEAPESSVGASNKVEAPKEMENSGQSIDCLPPISDEEIPEKTELGGNLQSATVQEVPEKAESNQGSEPAAEQKTPKKTDQELLDSALEFCQASDDYWNRGDLDNALDALDQAYSLILQVKPDDNPELLQQREDLRFTIAKRIIEIYSSRLTVANGYHTAIPLSMNRYVGQAIKQFTGREKKFFLQSYRQSGRFRPEIVKALKKAGLPEELSWLPLIESGFNVHAFSKARALGLWQFIASTGYKYGLKRDRWIDERMDPEKSTQAAIAYLKELHQIFGDWTTVLAAYNCGEGTVLKCIRTQRAKYLDNFWDLYEKLPIETASYVPRFLAVLHIIKDPKKYGITLPPTDPPVKAEKVSIDKPVRLEVIARCLDIPCSELLTLNPELKRHTTPPGPYELKVPPGKGPILLAKLPNLPAWRPQIPVFVYHKVRRGETLSVIARRYRTSVTRIMLVNRLRSPRYLRAGRNIKIPTGRGFVPASADTSVSSNAQAAATENTTRYVVRKGDSLWMIAQRFGTTALAIQKANGLRGTHLSIGQRLAIHPGMKSVEKRGAKRYRVRQGDSPYLIAQKHQMNLSDFLRLNSLTPRSTIFPGEIVLVKAN